MRNRATCWGYWRFFPADVEGFGVVPVWGFARVTESRSDALAKGTRLYGFWPMASHVTLRPEAAGKGAVRDRAAHRSDLPPVYNRYLVVGEMPDCDSAKQAVFYPLLATSYLLFDFLVG